MEKQLKYKYGILVKENILFHNNIYFILSI
jgi:hypothetical protein